MVPTDSVIMYVVLAFALGVFVGAMIANMTWAATARNAIEETKDDG